jgi:hypothetical protein
VSPELPELADSVIVAVAAARLHLHQVHLEPRVLFLGTHKG